MTEEELEVERQHAFDDMEHDHKQASEESAGKFIRSFGMELLSATRPEAVIDHYERQLISLIAERDKKHIEIYRWLLGHGDDFPISEPGARYNWRSELRAKLPKHILDEATRSEEVR